MKEAFMRTALVTQKLEAFERLQQEFGANLCFIDEGECLEPHNVEDIPSDIHKLFEKKGIGGHSLTRL